MSNFSNAPVARGEMAHNMIAEYMNDVDAARARVTKRRAFRQDVVEGLIPSIFGGEWRISPSWPRDFHGYLDHSFVARRVGERGPAYLKDGAVLIGEPYDDRIEATGGWQSNLTARGALPEG